MRTSTTGRGVRNYLSVNYRIDGGALRYSYSSVHTFVSLITSIFGRSRVLSGRACVRIGMALVFGGEPGLIKMETCNLRRTSLDVYSRSKRNYKAVSQDERVSGYLAVMCRMSHQSGNEVKIIYFFRSRFENDSELRSSKYLGDLI